MGGRKIPQNSTKNIFGTTEPIQTMLKPLDVKYLQVFTVQKMFKKNVIFMRI